MAKSLAIFRARLLAELGMSRVLKRIAMRTSSDTSGGV